MPINSSPERDEFIDKITRRIKNFSLCKQDKKKGETVHTGQLFAHVKTLTKKGRFSIRRGGESIEILYSRKVRPDIIIYDKLVPFALIEAKKMDDDHWKGRLKEALAQSVMYSLDENYRYKIIVFYDFTKDRFFYKPDMRTDEGKIYRKLIALLKKIDVTVVACVPD